jgi:[acyl-carrier-protein] S-malonyltransferase
MSVFLGIPGQGNIYRGIGSDGIPPEISQPIFEMASDVCGLNLKAISGQGKEEMYRADVGPMLVAVDGVGRLENFRRTYSGDLKDVIVAGHSAGELAIIVWLAEDQERALQLVWGRSGWMHEEGSRVNGGMYAVKIKRGESPFLDKDMIWRVALARGFAVANENSPRQVVVSGLIPALEAARKDFEDAGYDYLYLKRIKGAFHSPLMNGVAKKLLLAVQEITLRETPATILSNLTGDIVTNYLALVLGLPNHAISLVRWQSICEKAIELGADRFVELANIKVLTPFYEDTLEWCREYRPEILRARG